MKQLLYNKLRAVRKALGLTYDVILEQAGMYQADVSNLENGKKTFIPTAYIVLMVKQGVNLNYLFDDSVEMDQFKQSMMGQVADVSKPAPCSQCYEKDRRISDLKDHIATLTEINKTLSVKMP